MLIVATGRKDGGGAVYGLLGGKILVSGSTPLDRGYNGMAILVNWPSHPR